MSGRRLACNPCRKARIGCDASIRKGNPCSNCVRREKSCLVQSQQNAQQSSEHVRRQQSAQSQDDFNTHSSTPPRLSSSIEGTINSSLVTASLQSVLSPTQSFFRLEQQTCRRQQAFCLHQILWDIFMQIYEARFSMFLGESCCPYVEMTISSRAFISRLSLELDRLASDNFPSEQQKINDRLTDEAMLHAIYTYAARWLPLVAGDSQAVVHPTPGRAKHGQNEIAEILWRRTRPKMQSIMSRPSYRAVHALQIFGAAERPLDCEDSGFPDLCGQVQIFHILQLQSSGSFTRPRPLSPYTTFVNPRHTFRDSPLSQQKPDTEQSRQHMEDAIFWLSVMKDSYSSLVGRCSPTLLPHAAGDKRMWDFIRQRTVIFNNAFQTLHNSAHALPDEIVTVVLQHASACKVMYLNVINRYYNVVRFQNVNDSPEEAAKKIIDESDRFHKVFDPLLAVCARDFFVLNHRHQVNYIWLITHYNLGSLTLANILDETRTIPSCLKDPHLSRLYACKAIVNTLSLGLQADRHSPTPGPYRSRFLLEPVPEIQVEALWLASSSIFHLYQTKELSSMGANAMLSVLLTVLRILSRISTTASFVVSSLEEMSVKSGLIVTNEDPFTDLTSLGNADAFAIFSVCDREFIDEFSQEMKVQVHSDPSMVDRMIQKYEDKHHLERLVCDDSIEEGVNQFVPSNTPPEVFRPSPPFSFNNITHTMEHAYVTPEESESFL